MTLTKIAAVAIAVATTTLAAQAHASIITYDLAGSATDPNAGSFFQFNGEGNARTTFNFNHSGADVTLRYDDETNTAQVNGLGFNETTGQLEQFNLFYNEASLTDGRLRLGDNDIVGSVGGRTVAGNGFNFDLAGNTLIGHGWLANTDGTHFGDFHLAGSQVPNGSCVGVGCAANNGGGNGGGEVPAPAPLTLIGAMALFGAWRRKRANAK